MGMDARVTMERLDQVRARTGASYRMCLAALQAAGGDPVLAIVDIEDGEGCWRRQLERRSQDVAARLRAFVREGARTRIQVRHGQRTLLEVPAAVGAVGAAVFPFAAAAGVVAALATRSSITLERPPVGE